MSESGNFLRNMARLEDLTLSESQRLLAIADELDAAQRDVDRLQTIVNKQANDKALWFVAENITEHYLQTALRRLHRAVEGKP